MDSWQPGRREATCDHSKSWWFSPTFAGPGCISGPSISCSDCRSGYMISCTSPLRAAYGWQRDGGHAEYLLAEESTCVALPDDLSYLDGACVACGFGTAYEAVRRGEVSGRDSVVVVGLGPVGLAAGLLAHALGADRVIGIDASAERTELAVSLAAVDAAVAAGPDAVEAVMAQTQGMGCEVAVDCSGATAGRSLALSATRRWGRCVLVGEGGRLEIDASPMLIHPHRTVIGSWVTSIGRMEELVERLVRWNLHPDTTVTDRFPLGEASDAYVLADTGQRGKVAITPGDS